MPGFPNFFMIYGPGTNGGEIVTMLESQAEYAVRAVKRMIARARHRGRGEAELRGAVEPLAAAHDGGHVVDDEQQLLHVADGQGRDAVAVRQHAVPRAHEAPGPRLGVGAPPSGISGEHDLGQRVAVERGGVFAAHRAQLRRRYVTPRLLDDRLRVGPAAVAVRDSRPRP